MQMVEANVKTGMSAAKTKADLAKVYANRPDFVAFNEMHNRTDAAIGAPGYEVWRTPGKYTGANPVAWRLDRWRAYARGTIYLTIQGGVPPGAKTELGIRYANWVQLRSLDQCQTISIVSYHVAPEGATTSHLIGPSVEKLGELSAFLGADGPVILAGDLNRHYKARVYPRAQLAKHNLVPTWDKTGRVLPTGDHRGATIDYIFLRDAQQFTVTSQGTRELNSDHDALVANMILNPRVSVPRLPRTFIRTHIENNPAWPSPSIRQAVLRRLVEAINFAPKGSTIRLGTARLSDQPTYLALIRAHARGVIIQGVSTSGRATAQEAGLSRRLGTSKAGASWFVRRKANPATKMAPTSVSVSKSAGVPWVAIEVNQPLDVSIQLKSARGMFSTDLPTFRLVQMSALLQAR